MDTLRDEYWGQGGTYLLDPNTGKRTLIEQTKPAVLNPPSTDTKIEDLSNATPEPQKADPGKD